MATVTQAPGLSTPSMLGNPDGGAPAAATDQSAPCATDGEALVGEGWLPKGKMVAEDQIPPSISDGAPADLPPGGDKLAENGGDTDTLLLGARRKANGRAAGAGDKEKAWPERRAYSWLLALAKISGMREFLVDLRSQEEPVVADPNGRHGTQIQNKNSHRKHKIICNQDQT
ncbi:hypothetical protein OsI_02471 [Oryza sativa Indica Group]|uniref:Uncharacterized protein n=1 Tax=Oryza sativa subsp. indica TaxID=39946 RepID=B8AAB3_ORYSI|nr:hypothetical protein OsI_02471 [Oryza sativa Indica Group]